MKIRKYSLFAVGLLTLSISMFSCSGDEGDIGPNGDKGELGIQGEVGPSGADGSIIYSGEGNPLATTGIKGDYYFDVATALLYGPKKENDKWDGADSFSLKGIKGDNGSDGTNGIDGQDGTNGSKILSGTGKPSRDLGNVGDYYLNIETYILYGPRRVDYGFGSDTWGMGLELKGADGNANVRTFKLTVEDTDWFQNDNTQGTSYKSIHYWTDFPALSPDVYENGFVLVYFTVRNIQYPLPNTSLKSNGNFFKEQYVIAYKNSRYQLQLKEELVANNTGNTNDVLFVTNKDYRIKVITGKLAEQLSMNKDNLPVYNKLVENLIEN